MIEQALKDSSVIRNIIQRPTGTKTGIIMDGGGMSCVYGAGVVCGLEKAGVNFDVAIGCSAGTCNLAYYLAGQSELGASVYYEDLNDSRFISWLRPNKFMDIDYVDEIFKNIKPLNITKMKQNPTNFYSTVLNIKTGNEELMDMKDDSIDPFKIMQATIAVPVAYNKFIEINEGTYCDGGSIGLPHAIGLMANQFNCSDLLIVLNRPTNSRLRSKAAYYEKIMLNLYLHKSNRALKEALLARFIPYKQTVNKLWRQTDFTEKTNIAVLFPKQLSVKFYTKNSGKIRKAAQQGKEQAIEIFSPD